MEGDRNEFILSMMKDLGYGRLKCLMIAIGVAFSLLFPILSKSSEWASMVLLISLVVYFYVFYLCMIYLEMYQDSLSKLMKLTGKELESKAATVQSDLKTREDYMKWAFIVATVIAFLALALNLSPINNPLLIP